MAMLAAMVGLGTMSLGPVLPTVIRQRPAERPPDDFGIQSVDTTEVHWVTPVQTFIKTGSPTAWTVFDMEEFTPDTIPGFRFVFLLINGTAGGANRVTNVLFEVGGRQFVGSSEVGTGVASLTRIVEVVPSVNAGTVWLKGTSGSFVDVRLGWVKDPTFPAFGPKRYANPSTPTQVVDSFVRASGTSPYLLRLYNGGADGTQRVSNATIKLNGTTVVTLADLGTGVATVTKTVTVADTNALDVLIQSASGTYLDSVQVRATDNTAPVVTWLTPDDSLVTTYSKVGVTWKVAEETPGIALVNSAPAHVFHGRNTMTFIDSIALPSDGKYPLTITVTNSAGLTTQTVRTVWRDTQAPELSVDFPQADTTTHADSITIIGDWTDTSPTRVTIDGEAVGYAAAGQFASSYALDIGVNRILVRAVDRGGRRTEVWRYVNRVVSEPHVFDSTYTGTTYTPTAADSFISTVRFIFHGEDSLQVGTTAESIRADLAGAVSGRVLSRDGEPLPNVAVSVLSHPGYGVSTTRADGRYYLVVNGGLPLTLRFRKSGWLEAQRTIVPRVNDYLPVDSLALVGRSAIAATVNLNVPSVVRSRFASDANGDRDLRIYFPGAIQARIEDPASPGEELDFTSVKVRAKEFTVGVDGPEAMPAELPPGTAYTYCVDLRLDQADSLGASAEFTPGTRFTDTVATYVRNFLHLPVGTAVPVGYYDLKEGRWIASEDGVVLKLLDLAGDTLQIDSEGDDEADSQSRLDSLGITNEELTQLAAQFAIGDTIWRVRVDHFSIWDFNLNWAAIQRLLSAAGRRALQPLGLLPGSCEYTGSIIECENRTLGQRVPVAGTPYSLNYRSFRMPGDRAIRTLRIPLFGTDTIPSALTEVIVHVEVGGRRLTVRESPPFSNNDVATIPWDGFDALGRRMPGAVTSTVRIGYRYAAALAGGTGGKSYDQPLASGGTLSPLNGDRSDGVTRWSSQSVVLGAPTAGSDGLGGWTLSPHHHFEQAGAGAVYYGDGTLRPEERQIPVLTTHAANLGVVRDVKMGADGTAYVLNDHAVFQIAPNGTLTTIAGTTIADYNGDGPALSRTFRELASLAIGPDGTIYFVSGYEGAPNIRVYRIARDSVFTVAGDGNQGYGGYNDDSLATKARFGKLDAIAIDRRGRIYLGDSNDRRLRRVEPDGTIKTFAGTGSNGTSPVDGSVNEVPLGEYGSIAIGPDDAAYIAQPGSRRIMRVGAEGRVTLVASGDTWAPQGLSFSPDGSLYISSGGGYGEHRVYRRDPSGVIAAVAGQNAAGTEQLEGRAAAGTLLNSPLGLDVGPDGAIYLAESGNHRLRRIGATLASRVAGEVVFPSDDGAETHHFNAATGRHLYTRDVLTGAVLFEFEYDGFGRLYRVWDVNRESTTVEREVDGSPRAIVGPYGHRTALAVDARGYLRSILNPAGERDSMDYDTLGLMQHFVDAADEVHTITWAADGRLEQDADPAGGSQSLVYAPDGTTRTVTITSEEGVANTHVVSDLPDGTRQRRITLAGGARTAQSDSTDNRIRTVNPSGLSETVTLGSDPRMGMLAPLAERTEEHVPSAGLLRWSHIGRATGNGTIPTEPPFAASVWRDTLIVNGREWLTEFTAPTGDPAVGTLTTRSPEGRTATVKVDAAGRPSRIELPGYHPLIHSYDNRGRLVRTAREGRSWRYTYDDSGRVATITDTLGRVSAFRYDAADRLLRQVLPDTQEIRFGYEPRGNLMALAPPEQPTHEFNYTPVELIGDYEPPNVLIGDVTTHYTYDSDRRLTLIERPEGTEVALGYESSPNSGRLTSVTLPRGSTTLHWSATRAQLDSIRSPDGVTVAYGYSAPLPSSETWRGAVTGTVSVTYDSLLRVASQSVNGGSTVAYGYDREGLLTDAGALSIERSSATGQIEGTTLGEVETSQEYNGHGELSALVAETDTVLYGAEYGRDSLGRIIAIAESIEGEAATLGYVYDTRGRLRQVSRNGSPQQTFGYDANGNRTSFTGVTGADTATATYDAQDRMLRYRDTRYRYTKSGELAERITAGDTTRYTYDELGNLIRVVQPNPEAEGAKDTIAYLVDGRNRRVAREENGFVTHRWIYEDQLEPVAEVDDTGAVVARYVYGSRAHVPDYVIKGGTTYRMVADHLGSVRLVVNSATGAVVQRMDYDAWGVVADDTNAGFQCFGYAGGLWDALTGLVRFGARDYEAGVGRWTSKDPLLFASQRPNLLHYASGDPINRADPSGLRDYDCRETKQLLKELRRSHLWPFGFIQAWKHHSGGGKYDFKGQPDRYWVDGQWWNADAFGNFTAGYSGWVAGMYTGFGVVRILGVLYDATDAEFGTGTFDWDEDSAPAIEAGLEYARQEEIGRKSCECP